MINLLEIRSATEFLRNFRACAARLKETRQPMVLTVNGKAKLVVQDAASYQTLLDRLQRAEAARPRVFEDWQAAAG